MVALWGVVLAGMASRRLVVYHIGSDELERAVCDSLQYLGGRFSPTLKGLEDAERGSGVLVRPSRLMRSGSVEAYGREADALIRDLEPRLKSALAKCPQKASGVSHAMFGLACASMLVPIAGFLFANPRAKDAFRALLHSLHLW